MRRNTIILSLVACLVLMLVAHQHVAAGQRTVQLALSDLG